MSVTTPLLLKLCYPPEDDDEELVDVVDLLPSVRFDIAVPLGLVFVINSVKIIIIIRVVITIYLSL